MKRSLFLSFVILSLLSAACVPSLHPFYNDSDVVFEKRLLGKWTDTEHMESWLFERRGEKKYRMVNTDENGETALYDAAVFKLDGRTFLDIAPIRKRDAYGGNLVAAHTAVEIVVEDERIRMFYLDPLWLKETIRKEGVAVRHTFIDGEVLLTDTTDKLQALLRMGMNAPGAFEETEEVIKEGVDK